MIAGVIASQSVGGLGSQLFLDAYPNAATAFSVKKINSSYLGACMQIRRESDSAVSEIGFTGVDLDVNSISSFCGISKGYVVKWYDQSGNGRNAVQVNNINQPLIYENGSVILKDGIPAIKSDGINDFLKIENSESLFKTEFSGFSVFAFKLKNEQQRFYSFQNWDNNAGNLFILRKNNPNIDFIGTQGTPSLSNVTVQINDSTDLQRKVFSYIGKSNDSIKGKINGSALVSTPINNFKGVPQNTNAFILFQGRSAELQPSLPSEMLSQQFVFYNEDKTSQVGQIENHLINQFNI